MRKILFLLASVVFALNVNAQLVKQFSFGIHFYSHEGNVINAYNPGTAQGEVRYLVQVEENDGAPMLGAYGYYPAIELSDGFTLGLQSGLDIFGNYEAPSDVTNQHGQKVGTHGGSPLQIGFRLPVLAMGRVGNLSTADNDEGFGAAAGIGFTAFGFNVPYEKGFMLTPAIATEINYNGWGLRLDMPLRKYRSFYKSDTGDIPRLTTSFFSVQITRSLAN